MLHRGVLDRERVPDRCNGLNVRRMAVLWTCRAPALGRHMRCELLRNALFDFTPIITATACQQSNYVERYSRYKTRKKRVRGACGSADRVRAGGRDQRGAGSLTCQ